MHVASAAGADSALLSSRASIRWLGLDGARHVLVRHGEAVLIAADGAPTPAAPAGVERFDGGGRDAAAAALARALARVELGPSDPVGIEPNQLPSTLVQLLGDDVCRDIGGALSGMQARKDADEIALIARAAELADAGQRALREQLRAGLSELELWGRVRAAVVRAAGGDVRTRVDLMAGDRTAFVGVPPGRDVVGADEPVLFALACERDGYWATSCATVCCGRPSARLRRHHSAVRHALERGLRAVRPGATTGEVDRAMRERLAAAGLDRPRPTGYGIGRTPQEAPRFLPGGSTRLEQGMVLALDPGAYAERAGVRLAQTVVVAPGGARLLTAHALDLA